MKSLLCHSHSQTCHFLPFSTQGCSSRDGGSRGGGKPRVTIDSGHVNAQTDLGVLSASLVPFSLSTFSTLASTFSHPLPLFGHGENCLCIFLITLHIFSLCSNHSLAQPLLSHPATRIPLHLIRGILIIVLHGMIPVGCKVGRAQNNIPPQTLKQAHSNT